MIKTNLQKLIIISAIVVCVLLTSGAFFGTPVYAQELPSTPQGTRLIVEEPVGVNDTSAVSGSGKSLISVFTAMLILSLIGAYYLYQKEQQRKNDNK